MTGPTDTNPEHAPIVLIDAYENGWVEEVAWVAVTDVATDPGTAVKWVENGYPLEDRVDGESYSADGEMALMRPIDPEGDEEQRWVKCDGTAKGATLFWVVNVVCPD